MLNRPLASQFLQCLQRLFGINFRATTSGRLLVNHDVLFQHVVAVEAGLIQFRHNGAKVNIALTDSSKHAGFNALRPGDLTG